MAAVKQMAADFIAAHNADTDNAVTINAMHYRTLSEIEANRNLDATYTFPIVDHPDHN
ncbi:MAG: hypothetical protein HN348_17905 [Proteobacteria bacterium]|nr:hypothetical protein [Pseudomonadota bacterium]